LREDDNASCGAALTLTVSIIPDRPLKMPI
jgi:hypothetical protein